MNPCLTINRGLAHEFEEEMDSMQWVIYSINVAGWIGKLVLVSIGVSTIVHVKVDLNDTVVGFLLDTSFQLEPHLLELRCVWRTVLFIP